MKVCVIGGGIAGTLLAWRLAQRNAEVHLVLGRRQHADATVASGGVVRGYEPSAEQRELAAESLLELIADSRLRAWARYQAVSCTWAEPDIAALRGPAAELDRRFPGAVELLTVEDLGGRGWRGLPPTAGAIVERHAGYLDPDALRWAVLGDLAARSTVTFHAAPVSADATVVAAGAWTPTVLAGIGHHVEGLRTKAIQYTVHRTGDWRPAPFVDAGTGLYGRPVEDGLLLGLPTIDWDVDPLRPRFDPSLAAQAARLATTRFPQLQLGTALRCVAAADCYAQPALLTLRPAGDHTYTFTGGSGGAAKSALAASARAATALINSATRIGQLA